jgi:hypothetical protein
MCVPRRGVENKIKGIMSQKILELKQEQVVQLGWGLTLDRVAENYEVVDLVLVHNHVLYLSQTFHLMLSQRKISEVQAFKIEATEDSRIRPKAAHELASRQIGGPMNLSYTCPNPKNYLQGRRQRELAYGQIGSILKYFQDKIFKNPSFQYAL